MTSGKIKLVLFFAGLLLLLALARQIGFYEIAKTIAGAKLPLAFLGVFFYLLLIFVRSLKWFILAKIIRNEISYRRLLPLYLVNSLIGNLTPLKSGETATPFLFKKYLSIPVGQGFSIIILDRFFELLIFAVIFVSAVFYMLNQGIQNDLISSVFRWALAAVFLLLFVLIAALVSKRLTLKIVRFFKIFGFIEKELDNFYNALSLFKNKKGRQLIVALLTAMGWFLTILSYYLVFVSVSPVSFIDITVAQVIATGTTFVTFVPGGIGVGEVGVVYVLGLLSYPVVLAASGAILAKLFLAGALLVTGFIGLALLPRLRVDDIGKAPDA